MRKHYLDNIRWAIVVLVVLYHIIYLFNNVGVLSNIAVKGIPQMDALLYFVYPWFMACLFLVAGISAHYSLKERTNGQFMKERAKKLLIPSIGTMFLLGWISGFVTNRYTLYYYGQDYTSSLCLQSFFTNGYLWIMILAILGCSKAWFDYETAFTKYMRDRSFGIYILHYPLLVLSAYLLTTYTQLPMAAIYLLLLLIQLTLGLTLIEGIRRLPIIRFWLFGISKKDQLKKHADLSA